MRIEARFAVFFPKCRVEVQYFFSENGVNAFAEASNDRRETTSSRES
jgi:hypothetical protein